MCGGGDGGGGGGEAGGGGGAGAPVGFHIAMRFRRARIMIPQTII